MESVKISATIVEMCKKYGIDYSTCNPKAVQVFRDSSRLGEIYRDLKIIAEDLSEIAERNGIAELDGLLQDDLKLMDRIDHDVHKLAKKIMDKNKKV